ncbi:hypothetical protein [Profundibacter sp.]
MKKLIITGLLTLLPFCATAFEASDDKLYVDYPDLAAEYTPGQEYTVHAIIESGTEQPQILYVISFNNKGALTPLGAFRCDTEFEVLNSTHNGLHDIRCTRMNVFGEETTTRLQADETGVYIER